MPPESGVSVRRTLDFIDRLRERDCYDDICRDIAATLFDWINLWFECFSPMLDAILKQSGVPREVLVPEIAAVHSRDVRISC